MKKSIFTRSLALLLAMITAFGCFATAVLATEADPASEEVPVITVAAVTDDDEKKAGSISDVSIDDVREILNAISYEEYSKKYANVSSATEAIVIDAVDYIAGKTDAAVSVTDAYPAEDGSAVSSLYIPDDGFVYWGVEIPETAKYSIQVEYYPVEAKSVPIQRIFRLNNKVPFAEARYISMSKVWTNAYEELDAETGRIFKIDIDRNELRPAMSQSPEWRVYELRDGDGFYSESFEFVFEAGYNEISFESVSEPIAIKSISLVPHKKISSYEDVKAIYTANGYAPADKDSFVKLEAEEPVAISSQTVYPVEDVSSAITSPSDPTRIMLNTIGGEKWQTSGLWLRYSFTPEASGLYNIVTRFKQGINDGLYSSRTLYIYGGEYDGVPFTEATQLRFPYSTNWQVAPLTDGETDFEFYFEAGVGSTMFHRV